MNQRMFKSTIRLFNSVILTNNDRKVDYDKYIKLVRKTIKYGFVISPNISTMSDDKLSLVLESIKNIYGLTPLQMNNAFHKSWKKIYDSDLIDLYIEQFCHYITTYGFRSLGIENDYVFIPDEYLEVPKIKDTKLLVIRDITIEEFNKRMKNLVSSGIAMKESSLDDIVYLWEISNCTINDVKNRELKARIHKEYDTIPSDPVEFLRYCVYETTGSSLLIKNNKTIYKIKSSSKEFFLKNIKLFEEKFGLISLAMIFNRFKPIFLAFKNEETKYYINKISKLSKKYHLPMKRDYLNDITKMLFNHEKIYTSEFIEHVKKANSFRLIRLYNVLTYYNKFDDYVLYKIRNGKSFVKEMNKTLVRDEFFETLINIIKDEISDRISKNLQDKKVYCPKNISYALPTSEKMFIGNIPNGTKLKVDGSITFGIHWYNTDETIDLDLSLLNFSEKFGWDGQYKSENVLFSGDMTDAPKPLGATELFRIGGYFDSEYDEDKIYLVNLNYFNYYVRNSSPVDYKILIAKDDSELDKNHMIDPNKILMKVNSYIDKKRNVIGIVKCVDYEKTFIFNNFSIENVISSSNSKYSNQALQYLINESDNKLMFNDIINHDVTKENCDIDISPEILTKDFFINILRKE